MNKQELKQFIEKQARSINVNEIGLISTMQGICANRGDEKMIEVLAELKWEYIEKYN